MEICNRKPYFHENKPKPTDNMLQEASILERNEAYLSISWDQYLQNLPKDCIIQLSPVHTYQFKLLSLC